MLGALTDGGAGPDGSQQRVESSYRTLKKNMNRFSDSVFFRKAE